MNINCPHFPLCSGCAVNTDVSQIKIFDEAKVFFAKQGIFDFRLYTGHACGWRCRAKLAVRGTSEEPLIGLYKAGTHQVIDIPRCCVHHPLINQAVVYLRHWIRSFGIIPYDEKTGKGLLRYIELAVDRENQRVQLTLVLNLGEEDVEIKRNIKALWEEHPLFWHSLWVNFNTRRDNVILGDVWKLLYGNEWLWDRFCGRQVCFHPASFTQANPEMFEKLLIELANNVPQGSKLVEFYAGGGVIGLTLAEKCKHIVFNEIVPLAQKCFEESCKLLPRDLKEKLTFVCGPAEKQLDLLQDDVDVVVVDPPRKGIDARLLSRLCGHSGLKQLIYVSCGWKSFQKDCERLLSNHWKLVSAKAFLFFPGTEHLEILAVFLRD
jgi:23S rRNA (uracil1939-C5)-methyltransferase